MTWKAKKITKKGLQKFAKSNERTWARHIKGNTIKEAPNSVSSLSTIFYLNFSANMLKKYITRKSPSRLQKIKYLIVPTSITSCTSFLPVLQGIFHHLICKIKN